MFITGAIAIILAIAFIKSNILPFWGDILLIFFLIAILVAIVRSKG
jgi:hypothetical protein